MSRQQQRIQYPPPPPSELSNSMQFFIGLGIGMVTLIVGLLTLGGLMGGSPISSLPISPCYLGLALYGADFIAAIVFLSIRRLRYIGYGLLTMVIVIPVIAFIACIVVVNGYHRY